MCSEVRGGDITDQIDDYDFVHINDNTPTRMRSGILLHTDTMHTKLNATIAYDRMKGLDEVLESDHLLIVVILGCSL